MRFISRSSSILMASALLTAAAASSDAPTPASAIGFFPNAIAAQRALEQRFDTQLNAADLRDWMQRMSAEAIHVGAPHNKANAEFVRQQMQAWGWDAQIETFEVLYPTLERHSLEP